MHSITRTFIYTAVVLTICFFTRLDALKIEDIGFKVGWNHSTINVPNSSADWGSRNTLSFGGTVSIGFSERIGLQIECLSVTNGYNNNDSAKRLNYLQIPVLGKVVLTKNDRFVWEMLVGPAFSKKTNEVTWEEIYSFEKRATKETSIFFSEQDKAIVGGIDLGVRVWRGQIVLSPRYYWGLTEPVDSPGVSNRAFSLLMGYTLGSF